MAEVQKKRVVIENKKAYHDYEVLKKYTAGIVLNGPEVKSIRLGQCALKGNFIHEWHNALWIEGMHVSPYRFATMEKPDPHRKRKLLLQKKEIHTISTALKEKGVSCVALEVLLDHGLIKIVLGVVRGKKLHDKRAVLKQKDQNREIARTLKAFSHR